MTGSAGQLDDQGIAIGPVVAVAGEQPHALAVALDDQAVAVVFDFMDPVRARGELVPRVGMQGSKGRRGMQIR